MAEQEKKPLFDNTPYMWGWEELIDGGGEKSSRFTFVETGRATAVIPIRYIKNEANLWLIEEVRHEVGKPILKTIGGYNKQQESDKDCIKRKALEEAGIEIQNFHILDEMIGYPTIITPIKIYYSLHWEIIASPPEGTKLVQLPLLEAMKKLLLEERRQTFCDDATVMAIFGIYFLEPRPGTL